MDALEQAILKTLCYFDIFDYPLTSFELWKWLYTGAENRDLAAVTLVDIVALLETSAPLRGAVSAKYGFYFLTGRDGIVHQRMDRYRFAEQKFSRTVRMLKLLRFVPFVRMVGVCNTLAFNNSRPDADIDLFIITRHGRIWQSRFWVVGLLRLLNVRPRPGRTRDTFCASFFLSDDALSIEQLQLRDDIYLPYWTAQVVPVYDDGAYDRFVAANNWVWKTIPHWITVAPTPRRTVQPVRWLQQFTQALCALVPESIFKKYQLRIMPARLRDVANKDSRVIVTDRMLKFHDNDRRSVYLAEWRKRAARIL
ncbi:MAG: hypothetical protein PHY34_00945 [Patescibacteria group bacterium]|nr:hypothetical protein [Patescibacteria group bacterium]MDD5715804.1 hypothetical protein [Patescibacteria group bacterium]